METATPEDATSKEGAPAYPTILSSDILSPQRGKPLQGLKPFSCPEGVEELEQSLLLPRKLISKLHVMCISLPEHGHLLPTVHVAAALGRRRHRVRLVTCAAAEAKVAELCAGAGVAFEGIAHHVKLAASGEGEAAELMDRDLVVAMYQYYNSEMYISCLDLVERARPDVIIADFATPCAFRVAEELAVPLIVNVLGPLGVRRLFTPQRGPSLGMISMPGVERNALSKWVAEVDKEVRRRPCLWHTFFGVDIPEPLPPNISVIGSPAEAPPPASAAAVLETPGQEFNEWLRWVREAKLRIVYVTMGSMKILSEQQVQGFCEGLQRIPNIAVAWSLKAPQQAHLPGGGAEALAPKFFIRSWLPQAEALQLPEVSVVVSHSGWGGAMDAIRAGKPMVSAPFRGDQPLNANLLERRGMSLSLDTNRLTAAAVEKAVRRVLEEPSFQKQAKRLQAQLLRAGGPEKCAEAVEAFAQNGFEVLTIEPRSSWAELQPLATRIGYSILGALVACLAPRAFSWSRRATSLCFHGAVSGWLAAQMRARLTEPGV